MTAERSQPTVLDGIRVVDFCHAGVGPCTTANLADAGAQVIRVESRTRIEVIRRANIQKPGPFNVENAAHYRSYNHNKLGVTLDLKHPNGIALAKRLIAISDIVADSFTPGVMKRLGLGYEELKKIKPDIIQIGMSYAGQTGPYAHQRGHGPVLAALTGIPGLVGWEGGRPLAPGAAYTDHYLPEAWAFALLTALIHRDQTGEGMFIDASDLEGAVDVLGTALLECAANGDEQRRRGNRHDWAVPHGCYPCRGDDRWCVIAVFADEEWRNLCRVMGKTDLTDDARFATFAARKQNEDDLDNLIGEWTTKLDAADVMRELQAVGVRAGVVQTAKDTQLDPQLEHRHHQWEIPGDPDAQWFTYETEGYLMSETPLRLERGAPKLGEHNGYVFREILGLSEAEVAAYQAEGAIA